MFEEIEKITRQQVSAVISDVEPEAVDAVVKSVQEDMFFGALTALQRVQALIKSGVGTTELSDEVDTAIADITEALESE